MLLPIFVSIIIIIVRRLFKEKHELLFRYKNQIVQVFKISKAGWKTFTAAIVWYIKMYYKCVYMFVGIVGKCFFTLFSATSKLNEPSNTLLLRRKAPAIYVIRVCVLYYNLLTVCRILCISLSISMVNLLIIISAPAFISLPVSIRVLRHIKTHIERINVYTLKKMCRLRPQLFHTHGSTIRTDTYCTIM